MKKLTFWVVSAAQSSLTKGKGKKRHENYLTKKIIRNFAANKQIITMKKILSILYMAMLCTTAFADNEQTTIDATKVSKITFDGDNVNITYNDGTTSTTFDMAEVIINFSGTSSIKEEVKVRDEETKGDWYDLNGRKLAGKPTTKGVYIINKKKAVIK